MKGFGNVGDFSRSVLKSGNFTTMYGQVVIGPPGSGKSTYCKAMKEFLTAINRKCAIVNVDPANENIPYECEIDLRELITLTDVMKKAELGPNGGFVYCMEHLWQNIEWLVDRLRSLHAEGYAYVIFDFPGQIELYTNHRYVKDILRRLQAESLRLVTLFLTDSHYCTDPAKFISVLITALTAMIQLETPHVNVLSKIDLIEQYETVPFNLEYFCEVLDLKRLVGLMADDAFTRKYKKLSEALCGVVEDYGLVSFLPFCVKDKSMITNVLKEADKANGYNFRQAEEEGSSDTLIHRTDRLKLLHVQSAHEKYCKS